MVRMRIRIAKRLIEIQPSLRGTKQSVHYTQKLLVSGE